MSKYVQLNGTLTETNLKSVKSEKQTVNGTSTQFGCENSISMERPQKDAKIRQPFRDYLHPIET